MEKSKTILRVVYECPGCKNPLPIEPEARYCGMGCYKWYHMTHWWYFAPGLPHYKTRFECRRLDEHGKELKKELKKFLVQISERKEK